MFFFYKNTNISCKKSVLINQKIIGLKLHAFVWLNGKKIKLIFVIVIRDSSVFCVKRNIGLNI